MLLDPTYWIQHPPRFRYLIQQISTLLPALESDPGTQNHNWVADLFVEDVQATTLVKTPIMDSAGSVTEPEPEDIIVQATTPAKTPIADSAGSIMEPEPEDVTVQATTLVKTPIVDSTGSITEPESDTEIVPLQVTSGPCTDSGSTTEPESDENSPAATSTPGSTTIPPCLECLDPHSFFATPSPPPPDSIYWKYVTHEEDSKCCASVEARAAGIV
ncbi:uncharacterized protein BJ212DRAFT_1301868 [Suillus subaureus]|uniref:Uncharacterized protein n=1 Tax=Suillus subaureus TaxID=48587 RepID=A0A9P7E681_9AGAM|nr:uncharacterized protein BJ212DRAFT_1301868 [Suillus subaureus]KAG1811861.1 hypothetical protein BJ212DRAFT_1301868 [Suillus subaureus]